MKPKMAYLVYRAYDELENHPYVDKVFSTRDKALDYIEEQKRPDLYWISEHNMD